eukprot:SM000170S02683  [mRNA]  locus=s170:210151:211015:+ [translate_table: standard]
MRGVLRGNAGAAVCDRVGLVYQMNISPQKIGVDEETYTVDLKRGDVYKGPYEGGKPDVAFSFVDDDFVAISHKKMNPQMAFIRGKMRIRGSMAAAIKFTPDLFMAAAKM